MRVQPVAWEQWHDDKLRRSAGDDLDIIRHQVKSGVATLWECDGATGGGYAVTRHDPGELVVVLGEGKGCKEFIPFFISLARQQGLIIRTHVTRPGLIKIWSRFGVTVDEYVLRG